MMAAPTVDDVIASIQGRQKACAHENFHANVAVGRISEKEGGPIAAFKADITIRCADCSLDFSFPGFDCGVHPVKPTVSVGGTELRVRLCPGRQPMPEKIAFVVGLHPPASEQV